MTFEVRCEVELKQVYRLIQRALQDYREENKGPTLCAVQSALPLPTLQSLMPGESHYPPCDVNCHLYNRFL